MVSRRNYLSILIVFAITLFLFIFSVFTMDFGRNVDENIFVYGDNLTADTELKTPDSITSAAADSFVLYFGKDEETKRISEEWSKYIKMSFFDYGSVNEYKEVKNPAMVLVSGTDFAEKDLESFIKFTDKGIPVVFLNLPEINKLKQNVDLREYLGINGIRNEDLEIEGIKFYDGFLLGGEAYYLAGTRENEKELYDFPESMPWIVTLSGTKTFGVGVLEKYLQDYEDKESQYPPIVWRNTYGNGYVYAVNGDYMKDVTGLGFLTSILYDSKGFLIYPVVNSKNISVTDFPNLSDENKDSLYKKYNRDLSAAMKELFLPGLASIANGGTNRLTAFISTGYDVGGNYTMQKSDYNFYQQQLSNVRSELGISMNYNGNTGLDKKISDDNEIFDYLNSGYEYNAAFISPEQEMEIDNIMQGRYYGNISTFVTELQQERPLFEYIKDDVTLLRTTSNLRNFVYSDDLRLRSLMTALGYSNTLMEINPAVWSEDKNDEWQLIYDDSNNNLSNYLLDLKILKVQLFQPQTKESGHFSEPHLIIR